MHGMLPDGASRMLKLTPVLGVAAHHGIEDAAGLGLPLQPKLGRQRARHFWVVVLGANLATAVSDQPWTAIPLAVADGVWQALALQHYADWPFRQFGPIPGITNAEGLPQAWLPLYNLALLGITTSCASATICHAQRGHARRVVIAHLLGLSTMPLQRASAQRHQQWLTHRIVHDEGLL